LSEAHEVLIVGAGWIGRQVGLRMAICGLHVSFVDRMPEVLQAARTWMQASADHYITSILDRVTSVDSKNDSTSLTKSAPPIRPDRGLELSREAASSWESRVSFEQSASALVGRAQVVLECVPEQITLKRRILREFSRQFPNPTIIASNSSYFTPSTLAKFVEAPERFAHWHFHVPLHRSSIVDISGHPGTEPWVLERLQSLTEHIDQYALRLRHEHPGYVFNWLLQSLLRSALELAARDVVDIADIDRAWKAVSGMPIGPFAMMDNIGLDVIEQVLANARWDEAQPVAIEKLLAILREPIARGDLGVKTGRGFYEHE
jgi:3-hydroxybutyryl-CoA dehydrogenase